jgi:sulfur-oxidizing protein SoxZ
MGKIRVKGKLKNGVVQVKAMAKHPMTTYNQAEKKTGNRDDADFITHITATLEKTGETVLDMSTSQFLSKNPILKFKFKGDGVEAKDKIVMSYVTRKGETGTSKGKIKA